MQHMNYTKISTMQKFPDIRHHLQLMIVLVTIQLSGSQKLEHTPCSAHKN